MKAIVVSDAGGPEQLVYSDIDDPTPGPGEIVIDVVASGVNFIDIYQRSGLYPIPTPFTPGLEGAGVVHNVSPDVTSVVVGDSVAWAQVPGSYANRVVASVDDVVSVPNRVELPTAASIMLQGMTAHYLCHDTYQIKPGDTVLIHAAAGGVGSLLTQMAKLRGATVIATVGTTEKAQRVTKLGADHVIDYDDFATNVRDLTGGRGVEAVFDGVGADTFDASLTSLKARGVMALFGQSSGVVAPVDPQRLAQAHSVYLVRPTLADYIADPREFAQRAADVFEWVTDGLISVHIDRRFPLAEAAHAHRELQARNTTGKLLLI